jgi:hypothetical protein
MVRDESEIGRKLPRSLFMSITELAGELGRSVPWLYIQMRIGTIPRPRFRRGRMLLWPRELLSEFRDRLIKTDMQNLDTYDPNSNFRCQVVSEEVSDPVPMEE